MAWERELEFHQVYDTPVPLKLESNRFARYGNLLNYFIYLLIGSLWYQDYFSGKFVVDDPNLLIYLFSDDRNFIEKILYSTEGNRWRPLSMVIYQLLFEIAKNNYTVWFGLALMLLCFLATQISIIFMKLTKNRLLGLYAGLLILTSRFVLGPLVNITQVIEIVASIVFIYFLKNIFLETNPKIICIIVSYFSMILIHERFISLLPFLILVFWIWNIKGKINYTCLVVVLIVVYLSIKMFMLKIPIVVGTGTATGSGFSISTFLHFLINSFLNLLGFNAGPVYLNGKNSDLYNIGEIVLVSQIVVISIFIFANAINNCVKKVYKIATNSLLLGWSHVITLLLGLIIPAISTSRLELRWILNIYIFLIIALSYRNIFIGKYVSNKSVLYFCLLNIVMNYVYLQGSDGLYFYNLN